MMLQGINKSIDVIVPRGGKGLVAKVQHLRLRLAYFHKLHQLLLLELMAKNLILDYM